MRPVTPFMAMRTVVVRVTSVPSQGLFCAAVCRVACETNAIASAFRRGGS
ncbi:exported hypothetical protein [Streptomyces misionensis JCM 4497]